MNIGKFRFKVEEPYSLNFEKWYRLNCDERSVYHEEIYTRKEATNIFANIYDKARIRN